MNDPNNRVSINEQRVCVFAIALLLFALLPLPYGYYQVMRWFVCAASVIIAYRYFKRDQRLNIATLFIFLAVLYNPLETVHLGKYIWSAANLLTVLYFLYVYRDLKKAPALHIDASTKDKKIDRSEGNV